MGTRTLILVLGTDGSGKSTLCERLLTSLPEPSAYVYFGLREARMPWLRRYYERHGDNNIFARIFLFSLDYLLRRGALPDEGFVLVDRVPGWGVVSGNPVLRWIYRCVLPSASVAILCHGTAEAIIARKPERSLEGCRRDLVKWRDVYERYPAHRKIAIDTVALDEMASAQTALDFILTTPKSS
ncbi:MAG: hypothetical protein HKN28_04040 [Alphaproteobacteria bacterium]|nr:hypothetical protein [Alphaproteobacteria bacterium]